MSQRKIKRNILKNRLGTNKINYAWSKLQQKKYGFKIVEGNRVPMKIKKIKVDTVKSKPLTFFQRLLLKIKSVFSRRLAA